MTRARAFVDRGIARVGQGVIAATILVGLAAPLLRPPPHIALSQDLAPPSAGLPLGAGEVGVDVVAGLVWGARGASVTGICVSVTALIIATLLALWLSRGPPNVRRVLQRSIDVWLAFPSLLLAAALQALMPSSSTSIIVVLIVCSWAAPTRVLLALCDTAYASPHVDAARVLGASPWRLAGLHVVPQLWPTIAVQGTQVFGAAIVAEASLSFLGLGPQPLSPPFYVSWGSMLDDGAALFYAAPHLWWPPALAIFVVAAAAQLAVRGRQ
jgi:peptide/nickel transport system permease protein